VLSGVQAWNRGQVSREDNCRPQRPTLAVPTVGCSNPAGKPKKPPLAPIKSGGNNGFGGRNHDMDDEIPF
jgi:hypothetical protein